MNNWPKAVIFDMDGLMYDTEQQVRRAWDVVGPSIVGEPMGYNILHTLGMNRTYRKKFFEEKYGEDFPYDTFEKAYKEQVGVFRRTEGITVKPGLFELLDYLKEIGMPMVLATGSSSPHCRENLELSHTPEVFDHIICGDMVRLAKPDPYIYTLSCQLLGLKPEEVLVLEDSNNGVKAAYAAGTPVIMIPDLQADTEEVDHMYLKKMESLEEVLVMIREGRQRCF